MSKNGETVAAFERAFAEYTGARYCVALANGTCTLHTALVALGVKPGDRVAVPPLSMSSTTIAVLHAGAVPVFVDVDGHYGTWLMQSVHPDVRALIPVSLYGLCIPKMLGESVIDDAAQTLRKHSGCAFTSYSFQASKILSCGEGGALVTNDEALARRAREFSSLGYQLDPKSPRIDSRAIRSPTFERHHSLGWNYRMSDVQASVLLAGLAGVQKLLDTRRAGANLYREAIQGCSWLTPQHVPEGWTHDYWTYAVAITPPAPAMRWEPGDPTDNTTVGWWLGLARAIERHGGERPYAAWRLTYQEPAFKHLQRTDDGWVLSIDPWDGFCPIAESLQPRLMQFQTNDLPSAERNATALSRAIKEING